MRFEEDQSGVGLCVDQSGVGSIEEHTKNKVFWAIHFVYKWAHKIRYQASRPFDGDVVYTLFYKRSNLRNNLWVNFHLLTSENHQS